MPIHTQWEDSEHSILHVIFSAKWTLAEYYEYLTHASQLMDEQHHIVDMITNVDGNFPSTREILSARSRVQATTSINCGLNVVVKAPAFLKSLIEAGWKVSKAGMVARAPNLDIRYAKNLTEALFLIQQRKEERASGRVLAVPKQ